MTRRQFSKVLASAAAFEAAGPLAAQSDRKIGYCIVGLGRISMQHFMPGVVMAKNCRLTGIVSGHRDKAEKMAAQFNIPTSAIYSYETIDRIADNKEIDAVLRANINSRLQDRDNIPPEGTPLKASLPPQHAPNDLSPAQKAVGNLRQVAQQDQPATIFDQK